MIGISTLIVEDIADMRDVIRIAMDNVNKTISEVRFEEVGEADSYEAASIIIEENKEAIGLVVLDIKLNGNKTGIDLIRAYPHLSYVIISTDSNASQDALNQAYNPHIHSVRLKVEQAIPDTISVENALRKFMRDKKALGGFFIQALRIGGKRMLVRDIAVISKQPMKIDAGGSLDVCPDCYDIEKTDRVYFCSSIVDSSKAHSECLHHEYVSKASMSTLIEDTKLNPNQFISISQSCIVNLKHVTYFNRNNHKFYIDVTIKKEKKSVLLTGLKDRMSEQTLRKIDNRETI